MGDEQQDFDALALAALQEEWWAGVSLESIKVLAYAAGVDWRKLQQWSPPHAVLVDDRHPPF